MKPDLQSLLTAGVVIHTLDSGGFFFLKAMLFGVCITGGLSVRVRCFIRAFKALFITGRGGNNYQDGKEYLFHGGLLSNEVKAKILI